MATSKALRKFQREADAFYRHCEHYKLRDRLAFQHWIATNLSSDQLASLIDGEVTRQAIFEVYLNDRY